MIWYATSILQFDSTMVLLIYPWYNAQMQVCERAYMHIWIQPSTSLCIYQKVELNWDAYKTFGF